MNEDIRKLIRTRAYTCVAADDHSVVYKASGKGVKPIISPMRTDRTFFHGKRVADTTVGKAAALLLILSGARYVYGEVMSRSAASLLEENGIEFEYGQLVEFIKNRTEDGMCPLEECIKDESSPDTALIKIENKIAELMRS